MSEPTELKPCPFCGKEMNDDNFFSCDGYPKACGCWEQTCTAEDAIEVWNTRPLEDALRTRVTEIEAENAALREQIKEWRECAEKLDDALADANSKSLPVSWEDASESSYEHILYAQLKEKYPKEGEK